MSTRNVLNYNGATIGQMTLPDDTTEDQWVAALAPYAYQNVVIQLTEGAIKFINNEWVIVQNGVLKPLGLTPIGVSDNTSVSTSSSTFSVVPTMTFVPPAGTYMVFFSFSCGADSDADGEIAIAVDGTIVTDSNRRIYCEAAGLLGAIGSYRAGSTSVASVVVNGSQAVEGRYKATAGTIGGTYRKLIFIPLAR